MNWIREQINDFLDANWVTKTLMVVVASLLVGLLIFLGAAARLCVEERYDLKDAPMRTATGTVREHRYRATYTTIIPVGKVLVPQLHPARYELVIDVRGLAGAVLVSENVWRTIEDQARVDVQYRIGRNSGRLYIDDLAY